MQSDTPCPNRDDSNKGKQKGKFSDTQKPKSDRCGIYVSVLDRKLLTELLGVIRLEQSYDLLLCFPIALATYLLFLGLVG